MADMDQPGAESIDLKVDASTYVLAATFGNVAFPPNMPEHLKQAILDKADLARNADSGFLIDGRIKSESDRRRDSQNDDDDNLTQLAQMVRQEREEREREEWARTKSTVAGVTMTGAEWARLAERLRNDSELKEEILAAFRKRGMSDEEAERRYERVADVAAIAAKPESQRTEQEAEQFEKAKADPTFKQDMGDTNAAYSRMSMPSRKSDAAAKADPSPAATSATPLSRDVAAFSGTGF